MENRESQNKTAKKLEQLVEGRIFEKIKKYAGLITKYEREVTNIYERYRGMEIYDIIGSEENYSEFRTASNKVNRKWKRINLINKKLNENELTSRIMAAMGFNEIINELKAKIDYFDEVKMQKMDLDYRKWHGALLHNRYGSEDSDERRWRTFELEDRTGWDKSAPEG